MVKVFVASRPVAGLRSYTPENHKMIRLQDVNYADILNVAESFLDKAKLDLPAGNAHWAAEITEKAQGAFVWVRLVSEELLRYAHEGYSRSEVVTFLESLPTELEKIYENILTRLEGGTARNIEVGQKMLQFVLLARRPLGPDEFGQALAIQNNPGSKFSCCDESFEGLLFSDIEKRMIACAGNFLEIKSRGDHGSSFSRSVLLALFS